MAAPTKSPATKGEHVDHAATMLIVVVIVLNLVGLVMVLSASSVESLRAYGSSWFFFQRQIAWVAAGAGLFVLGMRIDHLRLRRFAGPMLLVAVLLLLLVLVPGLGVEVNGSRRWLGSGTFRFQPSEVAKLALVFFVAHVFARDRERSVVSEARGSAPGGVVSPYPALVTLGVLVVLVMGEPDMGTALVMTVMVFGMAFVAGAPLKTMAGVSVSAVGLALIIGMVAPYRRARLMSFLHPFEDHSNTGYQVVQSLVGVASGKYTGVGLGASRAKFGFLPNSHTDFIFAIIGEELGLLGTVLVVIFFATLTFLGIRTAIRARDPFSSLLAAGITTWIAGQAFINIGAVIGLVPVTGVPLPFVSFGGSALLFTMAASGVLVNIARRTA